MTSSLLLSDSLECLIDCLANVFCSLRWLSLAVVATIVGMCRLQPISASLISSLLRLKRKKTIKFSRNSTKDKGEKEDDELAIWIQWKVMKLAREISGSVAALGGFSLISVMMIFLIDSFSFRFLMKEKDVKLDLTSFEDFGRCAQISRDWDFAFWGVIGGFGLIFLREKYFQEDSLEELSGLLFRKILHFWGGNKSFWE